MAAHLSRRQLLQLGALTTLGAAANANLLQAAEPVAKQPEIRFCLNTSTIRGQNLPLVEEVEIAAKAGYQGIEPWVRKIETYQKDGGSLADLAKRISDLGLQVESAIGFANWIVDDEAKRKRGLEQAKREMNLVSQLGGKRIAAPPSGATKGAKLNLLDAANRYHDLLVVGESEGVIPELELWGFSENLHRLGQVAFVVIEANHPNACMMPDVYHIYKGGSAFGGLKAIAGEKIPVFHMNDYPDIPRDTIKDSDRVYPGDGIAPIKSILQTLDSNGFQGVLSLELFNPEYWKLDPLEVAKTGLEKMRESVAVALG